MTGDELLWLFLIFFKASLLSLGGLGALPILRSDLIPSGLTTDARIVEALTIGRISTGPGGLYIVSIGYYIDGFVGAGVALAAAFAPPLLVLPIERLVRPRRTTRPVDGLIRGVALVTSGLAVAVSVLLLVQGEAASGPALWQIGIAVAGIAIGYDGRHHPVLLIGVAGVLGLALAA